MGIFVNPDNAAFRVMLNSEIYVDKIEKAQHVEKSSCLEKQVVFQTTAFKIFDMQE